MEYLITYMRRWRIISTGVYDYLCGITWEIRESKTSIAHSSSPVNPEAWHSVFVP
jgi:hypothetical protein